MRALILVGVLLLVLGVRADKLLPWQRWVEVPQPAEVKDMESLFGLPWASSGGPEGVLSVPDDRGPWGGKYFRFDVKVDWATNGQSWPSFETQPKPPLDFSGYTAIRYWIRCDTARAKPITIRLILWSGGQGRIQEIIPGVKRGQWVQVQHRIADVPALNSVDRLHFFICESDYADGEKLTFRIGGFQLVRYDRVLWAPPRGQAAAALYVGERADTSDAAVILDQGTKALPLLLAVETGQGCDLRATDELRLTFWDVFTGKERRRTQPIGQDVPAEKVTRVKAAADTADLPPGYYLVVADVRRGGRSVLGGRVGCGDLYIRRPGESMTYTVLSIRTGMVEWVRDRLYGDVMVDTAIALPHTYDPRSRGTYREFLRLFAGSTGKHTEGNEAGDTGLALAAEAFRKAGDMDRCRYAERLLDESLAHMMRRMQAPSGGCITWTNELADAGIGKGGGSESFGYCDSNQVGEWMRPFAYAIIYYRAVPGREAWVRQLDAAARKAADYLMAHATRDSDGIPSVIRHLGLREKPDGTVEQVVYHQEGRQCDVYLGRALAGLSYYAYAMQLLGHKVPARWWRVFDNTVLWTMHKMKPNGWFDWQCEDIVEGGCHTFLGNIYIGEGLFGVYLAARLAGREGSAAGAAAATRKAYHYVTDDCWIRGQKFGPPLEFWVGPYVYWLFTEYLDAVGPDTTFEEWLRILDEKWSVEHGWRDFLDRGPGGVYRSDGNGMLAVAILGYAAIKEMAEGGRPLHWPAGKARPAGQDRGALQDSGVGRIM
jgi:hypothetical protein